MDVAKENIKDHRRVFLEDKEMAERKQLDMQDIEKVVGGAFNWYYDRDGAKRCSVDGVGDYQVTSSAQDRYAALKLEHKRDHWSASDYVDVLVAEGYFY